MERDDKPEDHSRLLIGLLLTALLTGSVYLARNPPLDVERPANAAGQASHREVTQAEARLWQDPLGTVMRHRQRLRADRKEGKDADPQRDAAGKPADAAAAVSKAADDPARVFSTGIGSLGAKLAGHVLDRHCTVASRPGAGERHARSEVLVMGVLVSGAPYAEVEEHRRRARYAVLAGLNAAGYVPRDPMHIQYVDAGGDADGAARWAGQAPEFLAYEWLEPDVDPRRPPEAGASLLRPDRVMLLWLDDDLLGDRLHVAMETLRLAMEDGLAPGCPVASKPDRARADAPSDRALIGMHTAPPRPAVSLVVLGPNDSDSLLALEASLRDTRGSASGSLAGAPEAGVVRYFPALATARTDTTAPGNGDESAAARHQVPVLPTTGRDADVAEALRDELGRRGLYGREGKAGRQTAPDHVALIHEWDTYYGRALSRSMKEALLCQSPKRKPETSSTRATKDGPRCVGGRLEVREFSYLRGLDGQEPSMPETGDRRKPSGDDKRDERIRAVESPDGTERPDGQRQFDYLQRLAARLKADDDERRARGEGRLKAVGLLGNDVYDKLVLLRALRELLPDVLFFTTDMDAHLFHPQEIRWTRGLLVASSFGLELAPVLQTDTPPFRDSHQTALYFATLVGMTSVRSCIDVPPAGAGVTRVATPGGSCQDARAPPLRRRVEEEWLARPRVFEIGLTDAVDLSPRPGGRGTARDGTCSPLDLRACGEVHPEPPMLYPTLSVGASRLLVLGVVLGLVLLVLESLRVAPGPGARIGLGRWGEAFVTWKGRNGGASVARTRPSARLGRMLRFLLPAVVVLVLWLQSQELWERFGQWLTENGNGEPLLLRDGISMWPQWGLRLVIFLLSFYFVLRVLGKLQGNERVVTDDLVDPDSLRRVRERFAVLDEQQRARHGRLGSWWHRLRCMLTPRLDRYPPVPSSSVDATGLGPQAIEFWYRYRLRASPGARLLRAALAALAYFFLGRLLLTTDGPPVFLFRGERYAELLPLVRWSVPVMLLLVFLVLDAIFLNLQFMRQLHRHFDPTDAPPVAASGLWPARTQQEHARRTGLPPHLVDDWIGLCFIARRTEAITPLVFYPAVVVSLSILASHLRDDGRTMPLMLWILLGACLLAMLLAAIWLRLRAERFREEAIARLEAARATDGGVSPERIQLLESRIRSLRRGAFAPYGQQPVFAAILLPLGSLGGVPIVEALMRAGI